MHCCVRFVGGRLIVLSCCVLWVGSVLSEIGVVVSSGFRWWAD